MNNAFSRRGRYTIRFDLSTKQELERVVIRPSQSLFEFKGRESRQEKSGVITTSSIRVWWEWNGLGWFSRKSVAVGQSGKGVKGVQ